MEARRFDGLLHHFIIVILLFFCTFQFYTAYVGSFTPMVQRGLFLGTGLLLLFLLVPAHKRARKGPLLIVDFVLGVLSLAISIYGMVNFTEPDFIRIGTPNKLDIFFGTLLILFTLEGTRRTTGWPLCLVAIASLCYFFLGPHLPGMVRFPKIEAYNLIITNYMSLEGILGTIMGAVAKMIFMFVLFGVLLLEFGGGDFFLNVSTALLGTVRGGPAKIAVVGSGLFGMISGIGPLNVMTTGVFTIPMMKKIGYSPDYAGAIEATASSGGQVVPPVMGIAAFVMADLLGVPYVQICIAALLPAVLYFVAIFIMVHIEAVKCRMKVLPREELPKLSYVIKGGWKFAIPFLVLVIEIGYFDAGPALSALYANIALMALCLVERGGEDRASKIRRILKCLDRAVKQTLQIVATVASVGIVIGIINLTGVGLKLSSLLIQLSHGILPLLLFLTMIGSIILGAGMPTVACYSILAVLAAPAMVKLGVLPLAAHLFVFYFGMLSAITPPVALSIIAAIAIAESTFWKTSWAALKLSISGFIIPYIFVYQPVLLMKGNVGEVVVAVLSSVLGIVMLSVAVTNYFTRKLLLIERVPLFLGAILLIYPGYMTDIIGLLIAIVCLSPQFIRSRLGKKSLLLE